VDCGPAGPSKPCGLVEIMRPAAPPKLLGGPTRAQVRNARRADLAVDSVDGDKLEWFRYHGASEGRWASGLRRRRLGGRR
jgi:hypothetical protein